MMAVKTTLTASDLPDNLSGMRAAIERAVPHGRSTGKRDRGAWEERAPANLDEAWRQLAPGFARITEKCLHLARTNHYVHQDIANGSDDLDSCQVRPCLT